MIFGQNKDLKINLEISGSKTGTAAEVTRGLLSLAVNDFYIWGSEWYFVQWTWIELLEWLAEAWPHLHTDQTYPKGLNPQNPISLEHELSRVCSEVPETVNPIDLQEDLIDFLEVHDLSRALRGISLDPVRILRTRDDCIISTRSITIIRPFQQTIDTLERVGNFISNSLWSCADERAQIATETWSKII